MPKAQRNPPVLEARPFQRVVVPVEGTDREYLVQQTAVQLAAAAGAKVFALRIDAGRGQAPPKVFSYIEGEAKRWGIGIEARTVQASDVAGGLLEEVTAIDLVVIGTRHLGTKFHVGSIAEALIQRAPCPVMVVRLPK